MDEEDLRELRHLKELLCELKEFYEMGVLEYDLYSKMRKLVEEKIIEILKDLTSLSKIEDLKKLRGEK